MYIMSYIYIYIYIICTIENGLPFSTLYSRPDAFRHLPSSGALTCNCYRVVIGLLCAVVYIYIYI